jgi:hypothetical protein
MKSFRYNIIIYLIILLLGCEKSSDSSYESDGSGKGGSMARFTIAGDYLYVVDDRNLKTFSLEQPNKPEYKDNSYIGFNIETIFPFGNNLFIGSQFGMYIYDITNPVYPVQITYFQHVYSCDPVVTDGEYAYVTLSSVSRCGHYVNELQIIDIKDIYNPKLVKTVNMTSPQGLGIDNKTLFVCDDGLKVYNVTDAKNPTLVNKFINISAYDVIPLGNLLLVIGEQGLYQYSYNGQSIKLISTIPANTNKS